MSDFIINEEDYLDLIHNEEDLKKFNRMKEIWESEELKKHPKYCLPLVIEFDNLRQDLHGQPRRKFIIQGDPQNN